MTPDCLAVIPDGTRRYARKEGLPVADAYRAGARTALAMVDWCLRAGIRHLAAFGSSRENVAHRPAEELLAIHAAVSWFCRQAGEMPDVTLRLFGDVERLPDWIPERRGLLEFLREDVPAAPLIVHVGVNYSATSTSVAVMVPAVDLVLRTGGQQRLSGFLPLESASAELVFLPTLWPELTHAEFRRTLEWFATQDRRFGE